jgi:DHA1 family multidrug resistance protein-like MFS transporter
MFCHVVQLRPWPQIVFCVLQLVQDSHFSQHIWYVRPSLLIGTFDASFHLTCAQFNALGVNWTGTLLGCVAAILMPIPLLFYLYGPKTRAKSKFAMEYIVAVQAHNDEHGE